MIAIASSNPSAWTTFAIAAIGAVIGGLLTAVTQIGVARYVADRQDRRDTAQAQRDRDQQEAQGAAAADQKQADEAADTRVAARITWEGFLLWRSALDAAIKSERFMPAGVTLPTELGSPEEHRILARTMSESDWIQVAKARGLVLNVEVMMRVLPGRKITDMDALAALRKTFDAVDHALDLLRAQYET